MLQTGFQGFSQGAQGISDTLMGIRERQKNNRSAAAFDVLSGVGSEADVGGALARVAQMVGPQDRTAELQEAMLNLRQNGMAFDTTRLAQDATRTNTSIAQSREGREAETHSRDIRRQDDMRALSPAFARDLAGGGSVGTGAGLPPTPANSGAPYDTRELLARTIAAEAGGEGFEGMLAVGAVMGNRAKLGNYGGNDIRGVIMAPGQFSALNGITGYAGGEGAIDISKLTPSQDAYAVADMVLSGQYEDPTGGATHYYAPSAADPKWGMRAGGNWLTKGNHVFGNPDGVVATGPAPSFLNEIGEGTMLTPDDILEMTKGYEDLQNTRETNADSNRTRDQEFRLSAQAEADQLAARRLVEDAARTAAFPEDIPAIIAQSGAPMNVQAMALDGANSGYVAAQFARPFDATATSLPGSADATFSLNTFDTMTENVMNTDPTLRIQATAAQYDSNPAVVLAEKLGDTTDDGKGWATSNISQVVSDLDAAGIVVSPSEAAQLLYESAEYAGWSALAPTGQEWGGVYANADKAVELAKTYLTPEKRRMGAEKRTEIEMAQSTSKTLRDSLGKLEEGIKVAQSRDNGERVQELEAQRQELLNRALTIERGFDFIPRPAPAAGGGETTTTPPPTSGNAAPVPTAEDAMRQAEQTIAATAIVEATGGVITLDRLVQEPPEMQLQILESVQRTLEQNGDTGAKMQVIEAMKQDIIAAMSR
jgi:spore germination cell wall hydrolase CwlJ-like protein